MQFNPLSLFSKEQKGYVGLLLREQDAVIMYLQMDAKTQSLQILDSEKFTLTNGLHHLTDDVDDALYKLEVRTKKTFDDIIFFVYSHAIETATHELKKPHLAAIKALVKSMELKPLGFIEAHEAYQKYLFEQKHQSFSALVIESDTPSLSVFVYEGGALIQQSSIERKHSFLADLADVLRSLREQRELPGHMFLLPSHRPEDGVDLIECAWDPHLFHHEPITKIVQEEELIHCLIQVFASQIAAPVSERVAVTDEPKQEAVDDESLAYESQLPSDMHEPREPTERMGFTISGESPTEASLPPESMIRPTNTHPLATILSLMKRFGSTIGVYLRRVPMPRSRKVAFNISVITGLVLIVVSVAIMEIWFHKATIVLTLPSEKLSLSQTFSNTEIPVKSNSVTKTFEVQTAATGVRDIGDPAKGSVTIYNSSLSQQKAFSKGTIIRSSNNLAFTLDSDAKVASASGDASAITSGTAKVGVTAMAIGPDSNLATGSRFTVADESSTVVIAKNESAFSGGTKRQVQVVSEKDIDAAESLVNDKAKDAVTRDVRASGSGRVLLDSLTTYDTVTQSLSSKAGEGASSLTLKANVESKYYYIQDSDVKTVLARIFAQKKRENLSITEKQIQYRVTQAKKKGEDITLAISATGHAVLPVREHDIAQSLITKSVRDAVQIAKTKFSAQSMEYSVEHPLPFLQGVLPVISQNITIRLQYH